MKRATRTQAAWRAKNAAHYTRTRRTWSATARGAASRLRNKAKVRANAKNVDFDLTQAWILEKLAKGCPVTGLPFDLTRGRGDQNPRAPSVDRIRAGGPYTKRNCRIVLFAVNQAAWSWGWRTFRQILLDSGWRHE